MGAGGGSRRFAHGSFRETESELKEREARDDAMRAEMAVTVAQSRSRTGIFAPEAIESMARDIRRGQEAAAKEIADAYLPTSAYSTVPTPLAPESFDNAIGVIVSMVKRAE